MATSRLSRAFLPAVVFSTVFGIHYLWLGVFPEDVPAETCSEPAACLDSTACSVSLPWWDRYLKTQGYWLGSSYALSLAFGSAALRRYHEMRLCAARNLAIGSVTVSGILSVVSCFLLGCCGSPMLAVYLNLLGAKFLPLAKPLIALLTVATILIAWWWMNRRAQLALREPQEQACCANVACDRQNT